MTPEEKALLLEVARKIDLLIGIDGLTLQKKVQIFDGRHIQVGLTTGTKIGTAVTQKLSVYGVTPIIQQNAISAPSGGVTIDTQARSAINSLITAIKNFGITA